MKQYVVLIVVILGTLRASAQNSALLAGSGTGIFLESLKDGKHVGANSVSFADNKGVFRAGNITYSCRYFLQKYAARYQYGFNAQGAPASLAMVKLVAEGEQSINIREAVRKADSIGGKLKQILSISTEAEMAIAIDGPQKFLGLERFESRTEAGGWNTIEAGKLASVFNTDVHTVFYSVKHSINIDSLGVALMRNKGSFNAMANSYYPDSPRTVMVQSFSRILGIPYAYRYTCYSVSGNKRITDSIASAFGEWRLMDNKAHEDYLLCDFILLKEHTGTKDKVSETHHVATVLDMLQERRYKISLTGKVRSQIFAAHTAHFDKEHILKFLQNSSTEKLPDNSEQTTASGKYTTVATAANLRLDVEDSSDGVLPSVLLFFLNQDLKPY